MERIKKGSDRRLAAAALAALAAALAACGTAERPEPAAGDDRPNVLLITLDTTRADYLGCYGNPGGFSPNLDRLAEESIRFERAISTSALTPMSHASILTGVNPYRHGLRVFYGPTGHFLTETHPTLARVLRDAGWKSAAFISAATASQLYGLHQGFDLFDTGLDDTLPDVDLTRHRRLDTLWLDGPSNKTQRRGDATTESALRWLRKNSSAFFAWIHYFDPHDVSLVPPADFLGPIEVERDKSAATRIAMYGPEIRYMDAQIGRVLDWLKESGEYDNTLILVIADHGQGLGQHGWLRHRLLYQEDIRLPFLMRLPEGPGGIVIDALVRSTDLFPTVLDYMGISFTGSLDGRSLRPLIEGTPEEPRLGYAEALNTLDTHAPKRLPETQKDLLFSIVDARWKLIHHVEKPENSELYDLIADPGETENLIASRPEERRRLMAHLERTGGLEIDIAEEILVEDPDLREKLRSLGYVK